MKKFNVNVPDEMALEFEKKLDEMQEQFAGKLEISGYCRVLDKTLPITERCRSFEDAMRIVGIYDSVEDWENAYGFLPKHALAYLKLSIIAEALNEGWKPQFTYEEYRYFPWFTLWWEKELADKSEEWKKEHNIIPIPALVGSAGSGSCCGVSPLLSLFVASCARTDYGGALATRSSELAVFFGKQFIEIWVDYIVGNQQPGNETAEATAEEHHGESDEK